MNISLSRMTEVRKCNAEARVVFRMTQVRFRSVGARFLWYEARTLRGPLITRLIRHGLYAIGSDKPDKSGHRHLQKVQTKEHKYQKKE